MLGAPTALNLDLANAGASTIARASVGIFGQQAAPAAVSRFIGWPVMLTQIWDPVQHSGLDEEVLATIEQRRISRCERDGTNRGRSADT